jgi:uncharacterized membrane protein
MSDIKTRPSYVAVGLTLLIAPIAAYFLIQHALPRLHMTEAAYTEYYWPRRLWLLTHTVAGLLATLLGPLQFIQPLRVRYPAMHRFTGKVYLTAVLVAATSALWLAATVKLGDAYPWTSHSYQAGLVVGAGLWLLTGAKAYFAIRRRDIARHRAWMIRNYTVTFFFITFFAAFDLGLYVGWTGVMAVTGPLVFACLLLPLAIVEVALRVRFLR